MTIPTLTAANRRELDDLTIEEMTLAYGSPSLRTTFADGQGYWKPGEGQPALVAESPAVAQAMGRCAASRIEFGEAGQIGSSSVHPSECGWCVYPVDELLRACDHATWMSRFVVSDLAVWYDAHGKAYTRPTGKAGEYENPAWAAFFLGATRGDLSPSDLTMQRAIRARQVEDAAGRSV